MSLSKSWLAITYIMTLSPFLCLCAFRCHACIAYPFPALHALCVLKLTKVNPLHFPVDECVDNALLLIRIRCGYFSRVC